MNQIISTGTPGTLGLPFLKVSTQPFSASHKNSPLKASPAKNGVKKSFSVASRTPRSCVLPPVAALSPTKDRPRKINKNAKVTIKDGKPERITIMPFVAPTTAAKVKVSGIAKISGSPQVTIHTPKNKPAKATID